MDLSPEGKILAGSGCRDRNFEETPTPIILLDTDSGQEVGRLEGHANSVNTVKYSSDGRFIVSESADITTRILSTCTGEMLRSFRSHTDYLTYLCVAFSPTSKVVAVSLGKRLNFYDAESGDEIMNARD